MTIHVIGVNPVPEKCHVRVHTGIIWIGTAFVEIWFNQISIVHYSETFLTILILP